MLTIRLKSNEFPPKRWLQIARDLELPEGATEAVVMRLPGLVPFDAAMEISSPASRVPAWLLAYDVHSGRWYLIHMARPRFVCRVADEDDATEPAGLHYITAKEQDLCEFVWLDPPPEDLTAIMNEAEQYLADYDDECGL